MTEPKLEPVAYEVTWPNREQEVIYASALRLISDLGDFELTPLFTGAQMHDYALAFHKSRMQKIRPSSLRTNNTFILDDGGENDQRGKYGDGDD